MKLQISFIILLIDIFLNGLQKPSQGIYNLHKNTDRDWIVNITAQSSIKVGAEMLEITSSGALISMKGSPIVGKLFSIA